MGREENDLSYDKDVLNQRSDPTCNQIHPKFSLAKLFYPSHGDPEEEEKHADYYHQTGKNPGVFDLTDRDLNINKKLEMEFGASVSTINRLNTNTKLEDLLSFDDGGKDESKALLRKSSSLFEEISQKDLEGSELIGRSKTLHEKDELINQLLLVIKTLNAKIHDIENTSRVNSAMLDNVIKKKVDHTDVIKQNANDLLARLQHQSEYLDSFSNLSISTEGEESDGEEESKLSKHRSQRDMSRSRIACSDVEMQTDPKPAAFPFGCQTNFANANEIKIKELQQLLVKQEEEFEAKLEEAKKMDDVEDAFQAFLDQLDLNENEERIIIDGESRVWKIIRCSKSIIEDECLEEEEEEDEDEKPASTEHTSNKSELNEELKEQLRNRDRPTNPMRKLDSPGEDIQIEDTKEKKSQQTPKSESKEGILIVEDNAQDSDSNEVSNIKDELEGSIGDSKSGRTSKEPVNDDLITFPSHEVEKVEKSDDSKEGKAKSDKKNLDTKANSEALEVAKSDDSFERDPSKRFPTLSDEEKDQDGEDLK